MRSQLLLIAALCGMTVLPHSAVRAQETEGRKTGANSQFRALDKDGDGRLSRGRSDESDAVRPNGCRCRRLGDRRRSDPLDAASGGEKGLVRPSRRGRQELLKANRSFRPILRPKQHGAERSSRSVMSPAARVARRMWS